LRIDVRYDDEPTARLLTRLSESAVPTTQPRHAPLAPGEQRTIELPVPSGASRVTCEITFERNHYVPGSYELPLQTLRESLNAPIR
jgi:hypothetical protein